MLARLQTANTNRAESFLPVIKTPKSRIQRQKRKTPPASRSPSPPQPAPVEVLTEKVAALTVHIPKPVQPRLVYASRIWDWFSPPGSPNDPFVKDPRYNSKKYTERAEFWIRLEHNFARAVDAYLHFGSETKDPEVLRRFKAVRRIQLVTEITVDSPNFRETRRGVTTYTIGKRLFHRWFSSLNAREILEPDLDSGWEVLDNLQIDDDGPEDRDYLVTSDNSRVICETPYWVEIEDPKNYARITIARTSKSI
jgi:hypothetical protein